MANLPRVHTASLATDQIAQVVDEQFNVYQDMRMRFERTWYDNNFFDDGNHFRFLSRSQDKIVDLSKRSTLNTPLRAIPKASRQIRGVANLLVSKDFMPVIYPERINKAAYPSQQGPNGETVPNPEYLQLKDEAKKRAKLVGHWVEEEYIDQDIQSKLSHMVLLSLKHGVAYMQVWPDALNEEIKTEVFDAFDIYAMGNKTELEDSPSVIKTSQVSLDETMANENFDQSQVRKLTTDNKFAASTMKEAYMNTKFGQRFRSDNTSTLIQKEAFFKEYLNEDNSARIRTQKNGGELLQDKKMGDPIIRQVFSSNGVAYYDKYLKLNKYPLVDYRPEPGALYQVAMIERFMGANKSLDIVVSRLERYINTMVVGTWLKRQGEQIELSNMAGGQVIEYKQTPPTQGQISPVPNFLFNYIGLLNNFIEEQGVTTTTLGKLPTGVKAASAIESLKESEFANLIIASARLRKTVKRITEKFLDLADDYFVSPREVQFSEKGEPEYFDIIGASALKKREAINIDTPRDIVPVSKDYKVDIQIQAGVAFTREGSRAAMNELLQEIRAYAAEGFVPKEAVSILIGEYLKVFEFGATSEFVEALEDGLKENLSEIQIQKIKLSVMEVMKDLNKAGVLPDQEERIKEGKLATAEAIRDSGLKDKDEKQEVEHEEKTTVEEGEGGRTTKKEVRTKTKQ